MNASANDMRHVAWWWLSADMPADWECVRYNLEAHKGRLEFHTREGLQAVFSWRPAARQPDHERILNAFHKDLLERERPDDALRFSQLTTRQRSGWTIAWDLPEHPWHASRYIAEQKIFVHMVFSHYAEDLLQGAHGRMLDSYQENSGPVRDWRLLGIHARLPKAWYPVEINAIPANVEVVFEGPRKAHIHYRRWGLTDVLLREHSLFSFVGSLQKEVGRKVYGREDREVLGHPGLMLTVEQRGWFGFERMIGKWWQGRVYAWLDERRKRMHAVEMIGPRKFVFPELADVRPPETV